MVVDLLHSAREADEVSLQPAGRHDFSQWVLDYNELLADRK
jgi:hypothetical protein